MDASTLNLDVHPEVAARIISAADQLFAESGKSAIPNVDTVRRRARVDMNDASKVMRAWRKAQSATNAPATDTLPDSMREAGLVLMQRLWREATELANGSLTAAQAGWEVDRAEAEGLRAQLAVAFDQQSSEMQKFQETLRDVIAQNEGLQLRVKADASERARLATQIDATAAEAGVARDRCDYLQHHIEDMRTALARSQEQAALCHSEAMRAAETAASEIVRLHTELLHSAERLGAAKEEAASLRGEIKGKKELGSSSAAADPTGIPSSPPLKRRGNGNGH